MSHGALNWVKKELDETLKLASQTLEEYVEGGRDAALLQQSALHLHQAYGTLQMVEVYGAAQLAEELEITLQALARGELGQAGHDAYEVLARAVLQLQEYLNRVHAGQADTPAVLLPLLNDLRALRGVALLSEGALFPLDLTPLETQPPGVKPARLAAPQAAAMVKRLRTFYQLGLLGWLRGQEMDKNLGQLEQSLLQLAQLATQASVAHLWWISAGLVEALRRRGLDSTTAVRVLLGQIDRQIRRLSEENEAALVREPATGLYKNLLYYLAQARVQSTLITQIKQLFALDTLLPGIAQLESARNNLLSPDAGVMHTVLTAIKEDMAGVKDGLETFARQTQAPEALRPLLDALRKVSDTLGLLGYGALRRRVQQQILRLQQLMEAGGEIDETALMQVAGELLYVESSLGGAPTAVHAANTAVYASHEDEPLVPEAEFQTVRAVTMREVMLDLSKAKDGVIAFNSTGQKELLELAPQYLRGVRGVMEMMELGRAAAVVLRIADYIQQELLTAAHLTPKVVEWVAEALSGVEYYLETVQQQLPDHTDSLGQAEARLANLTQGPVSEATVSPPPVPTAPVVQAPPTISAGAAVPQPEVTPTSTLPVWPADQIDEEIFDIFLEEANEVVASLQTYWPRWRADAEQRDALVTVRRGFHTLKGSGRMAGAHGLGELAWAAESLLNRVLDGTLTASQMTGQALDAVVDLLPQMLEALARHQAVPDQAPVLAAHVQALVRGEASTLAPAQRDTGLVVTEAAPGPDLAPDTTTLAAAPIAPDEVDTLIVDLDSGAAEAPVTGPEATAEPEAAPPAVTAPPVPQPLVLDVDDEILEIFLEEAQEVVGTLNEYFPQWRADTQDHEALTTIRRGFHTLKGSGRMVGAKVLGELAWSIENMLNRVLDGSIQPGPVLMATIEASISAFPVLLESLQARLQATLDVEPIAQRAHALSRGEVVAEPVVAPPVSTPVAASDVSPVTEPVPVAEPEFIWDVPAESVPATLPVADVAPAEAEPDWVSPVLADPAPVLEWELPAPVAKPEAVAPADEALPEPLATDTVVQLPVPSEIPLPPTHTAEEPPAIPEAAVEEVPAPVATPLPATALDDLDESDARPEPLLMDEALYEIFSIEAKAHLAVIEEFLLHCQQSAVPCRGSDVLVRAIHTLHGSAHMAGAKDIAEISGGLESALRGYIAHQMSFDAALLGLLESGLEKVAQALACINQPDKRPPNAQPLIEALRRFNEAMQARLAGANAVTTAPAEVQPVAEHAVASGLPPAPDEELLAIFLSENQDILEALNTAVDAWRDRTHDSLLAMELQRLLHTLKGSARLVGFQSMGDLAQALEGLVGASIQRHEPLPQQALALVHTALERLADMLDEIAQGATPGPADTLVAELYAQGVTPVTYEETALAPVVVPEGTLPDEAAAVIPTAEETALAPVVVPEDTLPDEAAAVIPTAEDAVLADTEAAPPSNWPEAHGVDGQLSDAVPDDRAQAALPEAEQMPEPVLPPVVELQPVVQETHPVAALEEPVSEWVMPESAPALRAMPESGAEALPEPMAEAVPPSDAATEATPAPSAQLTDIPEAWVPAEVTPAVMSAGSPLSVGGTQPLALPGEDTEVETYDTALIEVFQDEGKELLDGLDQAFGLWRAEPEDTTQHALIQRLLHTLKGSARLVGLMGVGDLTHALETLIIEVQQGRKPADAEIMHLAQQALDHYALTFERLLRGETLYRPQRLIQALEQQGQSIVTAPTPAPVPPPVILPVVEVEGDLDGEYDVNLINIFLEESRDILDNLEPVFTAWCEIPQDAAVSAQFKRALHTLKGGARLVGITSLGDLSHALETAVNTVGEQNLAVDPPLQALLRRTLDVINAALEVVARGDRARRPSALIHALERIGQAADAEVTQVPVPSKSVPPPEAVRPQPAAEPATPTAASATRTPQEQVRVRADLLDNLVNFAGEISIYRARLEQQWSLLKFNLAEFEQTTRRLREQLRKMELETEAQVLFRYEREGGHEKFAEFDPLEMDRYSTMQQLSRALSESVSDLDNLHRLMSDSGRDAETLLLQQSRVNTELQEGLMRTRMVPFASLVPRLRRLVRQTADSVGKRAELDVIGAEGEMDRTILDRITAPLEHLLRNALAHGVETPADRVAVGKPEVGKITLLLAREGAEIVIEIADDGRGIDPTAIRRKAIQMGLLRPETVISEVELIQFILESGFSTAKDVSQIAGRGVGMDVVNSEIKQMGGTLGIKSQVGVGSRFIINLPLTLAINQAIMVYVGEDVFAVPLAALEGIIRVSQQDLLRCYESDREHIQYAGKDYQVKHLGSLLGTMENKFPEQKRWYPLLLVRSGDYRVGLHVEGLLGNREVVIKPVGPQLSTVRWISGATILADGRVVLILDIGTISRMRTTVRTVAEADTRVPAVEEAPPVRQVKVLVVDDSITVRKVTGRVLERYGMEVMTAKDGIEALTTLQEYIPDIMLLDIEMPRMDGFELARNIRNAEHLKHIPIIMITSRTGDKHRQRAMELGVNDYIGKPFQEADLISHINALVGSGATA